MRFQDHADVQRLVDDRMVESPSLEFKRELPLDKRTERSEALKDLTAMGNGGGGTVLYGVEEADGDWPTAVAIKAISEVTLVSQLQNIVLDGVQPPLLFDFARIYTDDGFVLAVDVQPSPLGPYMVTAYGEFRYHRRIGDRTEPMDERQVRDAYALALRARERRPQVWVEHSLPMGAPTPEPWLIVSALPEEPLLDVMDVGSVKRDQLRPPEPIEGLLDMLHDPLVAAIDRLDRWADGMFGDDGEADTPSFASLRLHRDGSAGIATGLEEELFPEAIARTLNAHLAYLCWFWTVFELRRPVEVVVELSSLSSCSLDVGGSKLRAKPVVRQPPGVSVALKVTEHVLAWELARASHRHRLVRRFCDRLHQAFGLTGAVPLFQTGQLYGRDGTRLGYSVHGRCVWSDDPDQPGTVYKDGSVVSDSTSNLVGWWEQGCLLDNSGDTLGVLEMATGPGLPDDFLPARLATLTAVPSGHPGDETDPSTSYERPATTGRWSEQTNLAELFAQR